VKWQQINLGILHYKTDALVASGAAFRWKIYFHVSGEKSNIIKSTFPIPFYSPTAPYTPQLSFLYDVSLSYDRVVALATGPQPSSFRSRFMFWQRDPVAYLKLHSKYDTKVCVITSSKHNSSATNDFVSIYSELRAS
jgi:hypothetical protein